MEGGSSCCAILCDRLARLVLQAELKKLQKEAVTESEKAKPEATNVGAEANTTVIGNLIRLVLVVRHLTRAARFGPQVTCVRRDALRCSVRRRSVRIQRCASGCSPSSTTVRAPIQKVLSLRLEV